MKTIILRFVGMQSWGDSSKHVYRETRSEPTFSGVLGVICSAMGITTDNPKIQELTKLQMAIRIHKQGVKEQDFQIAKNFINLIRTVKQDVVAFKYYFADAYFLVGLTGEDKIINEIKNALLNPVYHLYLGRMAFPLTSPIIASITNDTDPFNALKAFKGVKVAEKGELVRFVIPSVEKTLNSDIVAEVPIKEGTYGLRQTESVWVKMEN